MKPQTLVLVPAWIERALANANKSVADMVDGKTLSSILSQDDLFFYVMNSNAILSKVAPALTAGFCPAFPDDFIPKEWRDDPVVWKRYCDTQYVEAPSLFANVSPDTDIPLEYRDVPGAYTYEVFELKQGYLGVRMRAADKLQTPIKNEYDATYATLNLLNAYYPFEELAQLSLFKHFVKLCIKLQ